jgi:hypothetical protein
MWIAVLVLVLWWLLAIDVIDTVPFGGTGFGAGMGLEQF